jgi:hypothetical protein
LRPPSWSRQVLPGPYHQWTRKKDGKTATRILTDDQLADYQSLVRQPAPPARTHRRARRLAGAGLVAGGTETARKNLTTKLNSSLAGGGGLLRLDTSRLRAT